MADPKPVARVRPETASNAAKGPNTGEEKPAKQSLWKSLGPGFVTGASDDDPSGIGTYSQAGAQLGTSILWTTLLSWPLMSAIQEVSGQIGRVTGRGLSSNMRRHYGKKLVVPIVLILLVANIFNLGADITAMGEAARLLLGGTAKIYAVALALLSVVLQIVIPYHRYVKILKWIALVLFAYVGVIFFVRGSWTDILSGTFIPTMSFKGPELVTFIAILGTTISPYLFFWQTSQEVEEVKISPKEQFLKQAPLQAPAALGKIRLDTIVGMGFSNLISYFIILSAALTLHAHHITDITSSAEAAEALRPIAGEFAFALFAIGIIGTGMLALPVLAGSAAYAVGEAFRFNVGLEQKPRRAKRFYAVLAIATLLGIGMIYAHIDPMKALYYSAVLNGLGCPPIMIVVMIMASNKKIMGDFTIGKVAKWLGWIATAVMTLCLIAFFATL